MKVLEELGVVVTARIPCIVKAQEFSVGYLATKQVPSLPPSDANIEVTVRRAHKPFSMIECRSVWEALLASQKWSLGQSVVPSCASTIRGCESHL
jgi:hypothetical protein